MGVVAAIAIASAILTALAPSLALAQPSADAG
jgi:hypothetical protein